ncbi:two-component sensor histidine kinase (plasmid) [Azospirillum sp. TSH58]|uniref:histidine kinase dimerization/phosphoacceptor domain -containing protein n=1 Tax=Azospirillum sp. TSH58 TaxID=664962 RepID=UPI000D601FF8|nr:histidine kinase dimerization/phosphoacceptor domain -containing protein [Azospirillum sp. TSH58]AWJ86518.1 two-component sensor histidine kinase [Azospirillum sp. TSH58]
MFRSIVELSPTPTAVVDGASFRCLYANATMRALGFETGHSLTDRFPEASAERVAEALGNGEGARLRVTGPDEVSWDLGLAALDGGPSLLVTLRPAESESTETAHHHAREVSHRVKNTLQLVSSLLTLQTLSAKDPDMRRAFQEACSRIGTVTQAHQRVHAASRGSLVDFGAYLSDACREMESHFAVGGPERRIAVTVEQAMLPVDSVIPLALIVNELVGNATKYAYAAGSPGDIEVSLVPRDEGGRRLTVADHGRGLPPGFEVARADSLGMKVARAFAGQLKGKLRAESNGPGARFVLDLPF